MVVDQAHAERNMGFEGRTDRGRYAGNGDGDDEVRIDGMLLREEAAEHFAAFVHRAAKNYAIGAGEIDVLENALLERVFGREMDGLDAHLRDAHHFARLDLPDVLRVKQIEGAGFGSDEPGVEAAGSSEFSENERAEAARVAHGVKFIFR